jgi:hypothetical protein
MGLFDGFGTIVKCGFISSSHQALLKTAHDHLAWKFNPDEHKLAYASFALKPGPPEIVTRQLMHALKDHLSLQPLHMQDAFVAQKAGTEVVDHGIHELAKSRAVKRTF